MTEIYDLKQTGEHVWQARYRGNYGNYAVKLTLNEDLKVVRYSCSCPSNYSPCKHIGYVQAAIMARVERLDAKGRSNEISVETVMQHTPPDELRRFLVNKAKYNIDLTKEIMLAFAEKIPQTIPASADGNPYSSIIADALGEVEVENEYYYDYDDEFEVDLDVLDEWLKKAKNFVEQEKFDEAILICKACIEEYAEWFCEEDSYLEYNLSDYILDDYMSGFFGLLGNMAGSGRIDKKTLYEYCRAELEKEKYKKTSLFDKFNDLMASLTAALNPAEFIVLQKALLNEIKDKSSHEAKRILERIINVYKKNNQHDKAEELVEANLQIESFCRMVVDKRIEQNKLDEAKTMINKFLSGRNNYYSQNRSWKELLLTIAQQQKDTAAIREISLSFLTEQFEQKHFRIYKSTFQADEWTKAFENLYAHYEKKGNTWFDPYNENAVKLLYAEDLPERFVEYAEKRLSIELLKNYHTAFSGKYPQKALLLFRKALDEHAAKNTGREHYEYIAEALQVMQQIKGGKESVKQMVANYRVQYKNRRAMMEILEKV